MKKDDNKYTMSNVGGEEVNKDNVKPYLYNIKRLNNGVFATSYNTVTKYFQHLGTLQYNITNKSAIFTPIDNEITSEN